MRSGSATKNPRTHQTSVPDNAQRRRSRASNNNKKAGKYGGMEAKELQGRAKRACQRSLSKRRSNRGSWTSSGPFGTTAEKPVKSKIEGVGPCTF